MTSENFISEAMVAGFNCSEALKIYKYITQDYRNIRKVYSGDFNESISALGRMESVAMKYFPKKVEMVCQFFVDAQEIIESIMNEIGL